MSSSWTGDVTCVYVPFIQLFGPRHNQLEQRTAAQADIWSHIITHTHTHTQGRAHHPKSHTLLNSQLDKRIQAFYVHLAMSCIWPQISSFSR